VGFRHGRLQLVLIVPGALFERVEHLVFRSGRLDVGHIDEAREICEAAVQLLLVHRVGLGRMVGELHARADRLSERRQRQRSSLRGGEPMICDCDLEAVVQDDGLVERPVEGIEGVVDAELESQARRQRPRCGMQPRVESNLERAA
jgi:hypothetical protein